MSPVHRLPDPAAAAGVAGDPEAPVTAAHFASIRAHPAVALLTSPRAASGYRNVYATGRDASPWCAKVRLAGRLYRLKGSGSALPHQAALHAVLWYRDRYGADWRRAVRERGPGKRAAVRVWRHGGGFAARVWEENRPVEVCGVRRPGRAADPWDTRANCRLRGAGWRAAGRLLVFATAAEAEAAARLWVRARWGVLAPAVVWRG